MAVEKDTKTLIVVCHRGFCRILARTLRAEGISNFQHGYLRLVCGSNLEPRFGGNTEVLMVSTSASRAEKFIAALRVCPIRVEVGEVFELYTFDDD
jgi:broad specificity phosphatase PhoE